MSDAGWLLLFLFLGMCSLIVVAILWPSFHRATKKTPAPTEVPPGEPPTPKIEVVEEAHPLPALNGTPRLLPVAEWLSIVNDRPDEAPHALIVGPSGSGKTTIAQAIASARHGYLVILDPKWQPGKWGGLTAVPIDDDGSYTQLKKAITVLLSELTTRLVSLKQGATSFDELTIVAEELPTLISECPSAATLFKQVGRLGRELRMRLVGLSQSERVKSLGIAGEGDARDNYTVIRLGKLAIDVNPTVRSAERPASLEWQGEQHGLSLEGLLERIQRPTHSSRMWRSPMNTRPSLKQGLQQKQEQIQKQYPEPCFSLEELGAIAAMIARGHEQSTVIRSMPRYNRRTHKTYTAFYERLKAAMTSIAD